MPARRSRPHREARANWSLRLPLALVIPDVMTLTTLADVRVFVTKRLPEPYRDRPHWLAVARDVEAAAHGGDPGEASMAIRFALLVEGVACRTK